MSAWTASPTARHQQRTFFDVTLECKLPQGGSTQGACGDADGETTNDFQGQTSGHAHLSCHLLPSASDTLFNRDVITNVVDYMDGVDNDNGGATCDTGSNGGTRFKSTAAVTTQEARVVAAKTTVATAAAAAVTEAEMAVAKSCPPGSNLLQMTIAGCAVYLPPHFPTGIRNMGDEKLAIVNKCYFVACGSGGGASGSSDDGGNVKKGIAAAKRLEESKHKRTICVLPKQERERILAQPPASLAALQARIKDGSGGDVCRD